MREMGLASSSLNLNSGRNIALNIDNEWIILCCNQITLDDLWSIGVFLGIGENYEHGERNKGDNR